MRIGQRVKTSLGDGTVIYWRMAPPDYRIIDAVSVMLDKKRGRRNYAGTMLPACLVEAVDDEG